MPSSHGNDYNDFSILRRDAL